MEMVIGVALANAALGNAGNWVAPEVATATWTVAFITLIATILFSVYLQGKGLIGMLPILLGAIFGYIVAIPFGLVHFESVANAAWLELPKFTFPAFGNPAAWGMALSIALIFIATVPESTSSSISGLILYIDELAAEMGRKPYDIQGTHWP